MYNEAIFGMVNNVIKYKGYYTMINYSSEDNVYCGKIEGIDDLITFESDNASNIENEFHKAVNDYILYCEKIGKKSSKP